MDGIAQKKRSLLAVLAHPDDETFGMGGTLALYARRGVDVSLVCATRGEAGEVDAVYMEKLNSPACLRTQELKCAAEILGIRRVIFLNYRDSGMPGSADNAHPNALTAQPVEVVAEKVAHIMRELKPDVVLTFDPIGGYRHPDHIAMHRATVRAFDMAADSKAIVGSENLPPHQASRLYFHTMEHTFMKLRVFMLRLSGKDPHRLGRNHDIDIASLAEVRYPTHVRINYAEVAELRKRAAACHASQGGATVSRGLQGLIARLVDRKQETFMQAYPQLPKKGKISRDLFAGL